MTRWLTSEEQRAWRAWLATASSVLERIDSDLRERGLTHADYEILAHLSEAPEGALRMGQLASQVLQSKSRLSYRMDRLEEQGIVARRACDDDARGTWAVLTPKGRRLIEREAPRHVELVRQVLMDHLRPQTQRALIKDLAAALEAMGQPGDAHAPNLEPN